MKKPILLVFLFVFFFATNALADIRTVYKADSRKPDDVFANGLTARGSNTDLVRHVLGLTTIPGGDSAFVSTSMNTITPMEFATRALIQGGHDVYYVYNIRPSDNFYYTSNTIHTLYGYIRRRVPSDVHYMMSHEREYSALSHISPSQIRSVTAYRRNQNNQVVEDYTRDNPGYIDLDTHPNNGDNAPRDWITITPNQGPLWVNGQSGIYPAYQVPADLSNRYRYWTLGCFGFISGFFK